MALVGRYETYEQLGSGSTGTVYRARDTILGREIALRILNEDSRISSKLFQMFASRDGGVPAWLHPNLAIIYDLGSSAVGPFVATELLTGSTIASHIQNRCAFSPVQKLDLIVQACDGLAHAHKNGIVHAAISPESFLVDEKQQLKLIDLGVRSNRSIASKAKAAELDYAAPEQISNGICDFRSDIFSASLVFYQFLVNAHPFQDAFIPNRIETDSPDSILMHDTLLPSSLDSVLSKAMSRSPGDRHQSIADLASAFRALQAEAMRQILSETKGAHHLSSFASNPVRARKSPEAFLDPLGRSVKVSKTNEAPVPTGDMNLTESSNFAKRNQIFPVSPRPQTDTGDVRQPRLSVRRFRVQVALVAVMAIVIIGSALIANRMRTAPSDHVFAEARVYSLATAIFEAPKDGSPQLSTLKRGSPVEILEKFSGGSGGFFRARLKSERLRSPIGYVKKADLGNWTSDDPDFAWTVLSFSRPDSARTGNVQGYLSELRSYASRFPRSEHQSAVQYEIQHWNGILNDKSDVRVLPLGGQNAASPSDTVSTAAVNSAIGQKPLSPMDKAALQRLLDKFPKLWEDGNLEEIVELAQQTAVLDPDNQQVQAWRNKARKALRKLSDQ